MIVTCWDAQKKETYEITVAIGGAFCGHKIASAKFTAQDFQEIRNMSDSEAQSQRLANWFKHMAMRNDYAV